MITYASSLAELSQLLPPGRVLTDPIALLTYEGDASLDRGRPDAVVFPQNTDEVAQIAAWAARHKVPLIARGAGTGLSGGAVPEHGGVIVQFSHMARVLALDPIGRSAEVEPGLVNLTLDALVKAQGLYFPPDPASGRASTLGGNLSENAGGPHCFKYGVTSNYVSGIEVVLADGQRVRLGGRALDYPEYDLCALLVGGEGTLGLITSASVRLLRNPPAIKTLMAAFATVEAAGDAVSAVIAEGLVPATMEMMEQTMMRTIESSVPAGLPVEAGAALIIEADGYAASVGPQIEEIATILRAQHAISLHIAASNEERDKIWYGRKSAAGAMARLAPAFYLVDGTVPRSRLAETLQGVNAICAAAELQVAYVFHAGDGNLHPFIPLPNPKDPALIARVIAAGRDILDLCVKYGGSITGEHGVGIEKRDFMPLMYSPEELAVMREIRRIFDPQQLMNPGKIFLEVAEGEGEAAASGPAAPPELPAAGEPLRPNSAEEAAALLRAATGQGRSVHIRGGGTKSRPHASDELCLSTAGLCGISTYARDDLYVVAGAGTQLDELQTALAEGGMWVPLVSPWPEATLGGIVASNFNAPLRMRYGGLRDLVLATTVALPDGRVIRAGRPVVKNVAGYDLPKLYVGSYGTLGLLTDVTLKLAPLPRARASLIVPLASLEQGLAAGAQLLPLCLVASALLLVQPPAGSFDERWPSVAGAPGLALVYTAEGHPEDVRAELAEVQAALRAAGLGAGEQHDELSGSEVWARWMHAAGQARAATLRVGVGSKDLPGLVRAGATAGAAYLADLASGLLYLHAAADSAAISRMAQAARGYALELPIGAPSAGTPDAWGHSPDGLAQMRALRASLGAAGRLNPGAFLV
jgi:D-lactate dehydrogenase (cytochrome)